MYPRLYTIHQTGHLEISKPVLLICFWLKRQDYIGTFWQPWTSVYSGEKREENTLNYRDANLPLLCVQLLIKLLRQNIWPELRALQAAWEALGQATASWCQRNKHSCFPCSSTMDHMWAARTFVSPCHWRRLPVPLPPLKDVDLAQNWFLPFVLLVEV